MYLSAIRCKNFLNSENNLPKILEGTNEVQKLYKYLEMDIRI